MSRKSGRKREREAERERKRERETCTHAGPRLNSNPGHGLGLKCTHLSGELPGCPLKVEKVTWLFDQSLETHFHFLSLSNCPANNKT